MPGRYWERLERETDRRTPLPVDVAAHGIARAALQTDLPPNRLLYAGDLRRLGREITAQHQRPRIKMPQILPRRDSGSDLSEDEAPFGWLPSKSPDED